MRLLSVQLPLDDDSADVLLMVNVFHELEDRKSILMEIKRILRSRKKLIIIDWKKMEMDLGPPIEERFKEEEVISICKGNSFEVKKQSEAGPYNYLLIFEAAGKKLKDIIEQIENVSKEEIKRVAPSDCNGIKEIILTSYPQDLYEKMVVGYLTSLCAEYMHPETFHLERGDLDYVGFELAKGNIEVSTAANNLGTCMKGGQIVAEKAGDETGSSMIGGEIVADEIKSIGNTIGGKISTKKVDKISKNQGAEIFINGVKYKRGILDRLFR